jgi:uncharacterized membrane protein YccF (DUF307 family)
MHRQGGIDLNLLLNIIWLIFGGFIVVMGYLLGAILLCITIIGIPFGIQCFKLAGLAVAPFGREIREKEPPGRMIQMMFMTTASAPYCTCSWRWHSPSPSSACRSQRNI